MENRLKLLIVSVLIFLAVAIFAIINEGTDSSKPEEQAKETEAREVVYLIFPTAQNSTQLEITTINKEPDSADLYATGIAGDYKYDPSASLESLEGPGTESDPDTVPTIAPEDNTPAENVPSPEELPDEDDKQPEITNPEENPEEPVHELTEEEMAEVERLKAEEEERKRLEEEAKKALEEQQAQEQQEAGSPIAAMYLKYAASSSGNLDYILYVPANATADTPIFFFLHGNGEVGKDMEVAVTRYAFLQRLKDGSWQPGCIIICPIAKRKSNWVAQIDNLNIIINEVTSNYGGSRNNMYLSGASAGADAMTRIAAKIPFRGAIYMAGHLDSSGSVANFLTQWSGKKVYYYRDNLAGGGYGYSKPFVDSCVANAASYNVQFDWSDLNWNHSIGLVDATFLPSGFMDANGRPCHNGIGKLIYGQ